MSSAFAPPILVCTLGAQPQVVTLCLDLLKRAGRWTSELVVHSSLQRFDAFDQLCD